MTQANINESKAFKVYVKSTHSSHTWYAKYVGRVIEVLESPETPDYYKRLDREGYVIPKYDCELIQDTPEPFMFQGYPLNVGDKLWHDKRGECKVISINADAPRSIAVDSYGSFLRNGCYNADDQEPTLYWDKPQFELPKKPEPKVKKYLVLFKDVTNEFKISKAYYVSLVEFERIVPCEPIQLILESAKEF